MAPKNEFKNPFGMGNPIFLWVIKDLGVQGLLQPRLVQLYEDLCKQVTCNDSCICFVKETCCIVLCCRPYLDYLMRLLLCTNDYGITYNPLNFWYVL
jgi:hypothetical protein